MIEKNKMHNTILQRVKYFLNVKMINLKKLSKNIVAGFILYEHTQILFI